MAADGASTLPLFAGMTPGERSRVLGTAREVRYADGERLFEAGEPAVGCWIIHSGQVALDTPIPGRGDVVVQTVGPGDLVGWSWLVPPRQWHFGARAVGPTSAAMLDTHQLLVLAEQDPTFGYSLLLTLFQAVLHRLQATRARLLDLYRNPAVAPPERP